MAEIVFFLLVSVVTVWGFQRLTFKASKAQLIWTFGAKKIFWLLFLHLALGHTKPNLVNIILTIYLNQIASCPPLIYLLSIHGNISEVA